MTVHLQKLQLAACVCERPQLYTAGGSLAEVLAFLSGYDLAKRFGMNVTDDSPSQVLQWLSATCSYKESESPSNRLEKILAHFGSEKAALESIDEFLKARRESASAKI